MEKLISLKKLLWIDCLAAGLSGLLVTLFKTPLAEFTGLPNNLLTILSLISLGYAAFSMSLARQEFAPKRLVKILVFANATYAVSCLILIAFLYPLMTLIGVVYLLLESTFVAYLAVLEHRKIKDAV